MFLTFSGILRFLIRSRANLNKAGSRSIDQHQWINELVFIYIYRLWLQWVRPCARPWYIWSSLAVLDESKAFGL